MRAAFALSQDGLLALLYGNGAIESANATIHVMVSAPVLIGIIAVEAATLLASTAVPAIRASKATAIDALRQPRDPQGTLANHRLYAAITRPLRRRGILRDFSRKIDEVYISFGGIPHLLARRNLNRPNSKGRIAVVSLAISVALLVLSGALIQYLEQTVDIVGTQGVDITAYLDREIQEGESVTDLLADARTVGDKLESQSDAELVGYSSFLSSYGSLSNGVYNARALDSIQSETDALSDDPPTIIDDSYYGIIHLEFVDDESWSSYIESLGLNKDEYCGRRQSRSRGFQRGVSPMGWQALHGEEFFQIPARRPSTPASGLSTNHGLTLSGWDKTDNLRWNTISTTTARRRYASQWKQPYRAPMNYR